jgi:hypothetical protein
MDPLRLNDKLTVYLPLLPGVIRDVSWTMKARKEALSWQVYLCSLQDTWINRPKTQVIPVARWVCWHRDTGILLRSLCYGGQVHACALNLGWKGFAFRFAQPETRMSGLNCQPTSVTG